MGTSGLYVKKIPPVFMHLSDSPKKTIHLHIMAKEGNESWKFLTFALVIPVRKPPDLRAGDGDSHTGHNNDVNSLAEDGGTKPGLDSAAQG